MIKHEEYNKLTGIYVCEHWEKFIEKKFDIIKNKLWIVGNASKKFKFKEIIKILI